MTDAAPRVVVLGRAGDAQQQLQNALNELGAKTLAVGDFDKLDPAEMREQQPDVWLVSMDESTDAAQLERWQPLFDDPDATVVFDDADVTRRLSGWDLARWARHLAAKVLGRNDVLPPVSPDAERLPQPSLDMPALDMHDVAIDHDVGELDSAGMALDGTVAELPPLAMDDNAADESPAHAQASLADDANDADFAALSASFDAERVQQDADREEHPPAMALDDLLRVQSADGDAAVAGSAEPAKTAAPASPAAKSSLSLLDMDSDLSTPRAAVQPAPEVGIDVSHLELQPIEDPTVAAAAVSPNGGLIAIIAGLGGPDAVRQFLGALPATLPVPVLLWQHLDAGKHDRLAQQLGKATKLPVYQAKPGELAKSGAVGVMGAGMAVTGDSGWWFQKGSPSPSHALAAALNDPATVVVVLSGAEAAIIEFARTHSAHGGQVLVQTPASCFDSTAASALDGQGVTASPAELAASAAAHWTA